MMTKSEKLEAWTRFAIAAVSAATASRSHPSGLTTFSVLYGDVVDVADYLLGELEKRELKFDQQEPKERPR